MFAGLYPKLIGLAVILALVAGALFYVHTLRADNAALTTKVTQEADQIKILSDDLTKQNEAIDLLKKDGDARLAKAAADLDIAKKAALVQAQKAMDTYRKKPSTPGTTCEADHKSTLDLLNGGAQ